LPDRGLDVLSLTRPRPGTLRDSCGLRRWWGSLHQDRRPSGRNDVAEVTTRALGTILAG